MKMCRNFEGGMQKWSHLAVVPVTRRPSYRDYTLVALSEYIEKQLIIKAKY